MGYNLEKLRFVFEIIAFRSKMRKHFVLRIIEKAKAEEKFRPLPESLANPQGLMVLSSLAIHGFLDEHFQPKGLSVAKTAVLASQISTKLGIQNVWVVFGTFWNIDKENLRSAFNKGMEQQQMSGFIGETAKSINIC